GLGGGRRNARHPRIEVKGFHPGERSAGAASADQSKAAGTIIAERAMVLMGADGAAVERHEGGEAAVLGAVGDLHAPYHGIGALATLAVRLGVPVRCRDSRTDPRIDQSLARALHIRSILVTPLEFPAGTSGVLIVTARAPRAFGRRDAEVLEALRDLVDAARRHATVAAAEVLARRETLYQQQLSMIIAHLPVILFTIDTNGIYTLSEGQGLPAIGRKPGEIVGRSINDVWAHSTEGRDSVWRTLKGQTTTTKVVINEVILESRLTPVRDDEGTITGLIGVSVDITEQVRADEAILAGEQRFRALVDHAPVGICITGEGRVIETANPAFQKLFGYTAAEVLGRGLADLIPEAKLLLGSRPDRLSEEVETRTRDGRGLTCLIAAAPIGGQGDEGKHAVFFIDLSEQARAHRRTEDARARAERLAQSRGDFVASVSHELRTPLTAIVGYAELLQARWHSIDEGRKLDQIQRIVLSANRQQRLVEDLLLLSQVEYEVQAETAEPIDLAVLVERAAMEVRGAYRDQPIIVEGQRGARVAVHPDHALQILVNLLDNAAKYSSEGSPIRVGWHEETGEIALLVRDHGPGIPEPGRAQLFQRFGRIPDSHARSGHVGTGLGLYIARKLAEGMGGTLDLAETSPEGSTFRLLLPVGRE
ncbi:MAG: ATP-binding protein, partial [Chloroflexota bacterium]